MHQHISACLSFSMFRLHPVSAASTNRAPLKEEKNKIKSIFVYIFCPACTELVVKLFMCITQELSDGSGDGAKSSVSTSKTTSSPQFFGSSLKGGGEGGLGHISAHRLLALTRSFYFACALTLGLPATVAGGLSNKKAHVHPCGSLEVREHLSSWSRDCQVASGGSSAEIWI